MIRFLVLSLRKTSLLSQQSYLQTPNNNSQPSKVEENSEEGRRSEPLGNVKEEFDSLENLEKDEEKNGQENVNNNIPDQGRDGETNVNEGGPQLPGKTQNREHNVKKRDHNGTSLFLSS